jgi:spore maturation protein SpmA
VPKRLPGATADVTVVQVSVVLARVATAAQAPAALVIAVLNAEVIVSVTEPRVKTAARDWVMRLSAPNAKPWSAPKCRCASWPHKRMARPWAV